MNSYFCSLLTRLQMNKDKYVFSQLLEFIGYDKFRHLVDKYDGNMYVKHLTC